MYRDSCLHSEASASDGTDIISIGSIMQAMQLRTPSILTAYTNISMWLRDWLNSFGTRHCMAVLPDPFSIFPKGVWARDYPLASSQAPPIFYLAAVEKAPWLRDKIWEGPGDEANSPLHIGSK